MNISVHHNTVVKPLFEPAPARTAPQPSASPLTEATQGVKTKFELGKLLVVTPPGSVPLSLRESPLLNRALALAKSTQAEITLLHLDHKQALDFPPFRRATDLEADKQQRLAEASENLAALGDEMGRRGVQVTTKVLWHPSRTEATLEHAGAENVDLIMKMSNDNRYLFGLLTNTDWELIRQSPLPVWFVKEDSDPSQGVVTAIGSTSEEAAHEDGGALFTESDYETYRLAERITATFDSEITTVHAFEAPSNLTGYTPLYALPGNAAVEYELAREERDRIAAVHYKELNAFANQFGLDKDSLVLRQGRPTRVLVDEAKKRKAGALVIGARELGALERLRRRVTAEPLLASAPCDVIVARRPSDDLLPAADAIEVPLLSHAG